MEFVLHFATHALAFVSGLFFGYALLHFHQSWLVVHLDKKRAAISAAAKATLEADVAKLDQETKTALKVAETDGTAAVSAVRTDVGAAISDVKEAL